MCYLSTLARQNDEYREKSRVSDSDPYLIRPSGSGGNNYRQTTKEHYGGSQNVKPGHRSLFRPAATPHMKKSIKNVTFST